ncbi:hypothetical protein EUX98_g4729 [Antrodiella citrinella]|uniref:Uncharacterized protein n=1 Tax=Antrodiella citrinella TaxID=2447956 RepID=A0A4S4MTG1_9APHY|nr:hypothetical protein EUX98_g4729 [Antrodiella citrinella]
MVETRSGRTAPLPPPPPVKPRPKPRMKRRPVAAAEEEERDEEGAGDDVGHEPAPNSGPHVEDREGRTGDDELNGSTGHLKVRQDATRETDVYESKGARNVSHVATAMAIAGMSSASIQRSSNREGSVEEPVRRSGRVPIPSAKVRDDRKRVRSVPPAVSADESSASDEADDFAKTVSKENPPSSESEDDLADDGDPEDAGTLELITTGKGKARGKRGRAEKKVKEKKQPLKNKGDAKGKGKAVISENEEGDATNVKKGKERMQYPLRAASPEPLRAADSHPLPDPKPMGRGPRPIPASDAQLKMEEKNVVAEIEEIVRGASESAEGKVFERPARGPLSDEARARCEDVRDKLDELMSLWSRIHRKPPEIFAQHMGMSLKALPSRNTKLWDLFQFKYRRDFPDVVYDAKEASIAYYKLQAEQDDWPDEEVDNYWENIRTAFNESRKNTPAGKKDSSDAAQRGYVEAFANSMTKMANTFGRVNGSHVLGIVLHVPIDNGPQYFQVFGNTTETRALLRANSDIVNPFIGYLRTAIGALKLLRMGWNLGPFLDTILRWSATHPIPQPQALASWPPGAEDESENEKAGQGKRKAKRKAKGKAQPTNSEKDESDEEDDEDTSGTAKKVPTAERKAAFREQTFARFSAAAKATTIGWDDSKSQFPGNRKWTWPGPQYDRKKVPYDHLGEGRGWEFERLTEEEWSYRKTSQAWSDVPLVVNTDGDALWRVRDSQAWRKVTLSGQSDESRPDRVAGEKRKHVVELHASEPALKKMKPKHDLDEVDRMSASPEATHLTPVRQPPRPIRRPDPDSHAQAGPSRVARETLDWEMEDDTLFPPSPHVLPSARQHSPPGRQAVPPDVDTRRDARQKAVKLQTARTTLRHAQENYDLLYGQSMTLNAELTAWSVEYGGVPEGSEAQMAQQIIGADLLNELDLLNQELQKAKDARQAAIKAVKLLENV